MAKKKKTEDRKRPGGKTSARPLPIFWIADCSGSMSGDKIQALNQAVKEAIPHIQAEAQKNPHAAIKKWVISFSDSVKWLTLDSPLEEFQWKDLQAGGCTAMGEALRRVAEELELDNLGDRGLRPVLILISDGQPTDDFKGGLSALMNTPWGRKSIRIAVAIGRDADRGCLQEFIGNPEFQPVEANTPEQLVERIKWESTQATRSALGSPNVHEPGSGPVPTVSASQVAVDDTW